MVVGEHLICQKVIVPYMKDADNDILFTMKVNEMKVCKDVYGLRWHLRTRFETGTVRKTEVSLITSSIMCISNRGHVFLVGGIRLHPTGVFSNVLMQKKRHGSRKNLIFQKVIVSYMKDVDNDILFTMKVNEMKVCKDVYGLRWHLRTRFETGTVRKTEVMAVRTI